MRVRDYQWPPRSIRPSFRSVGIVVGVVVVLALSGCSQRGTGASLEDRASKYWELKQAKRWEEVYDDFLDPAVKEALPRDAFLKKRRLAFDTLSYSVVEAREDGDTGTVRVTTDANIPLRDTKGGVQLTRKTVTVEEQWNKRDGVWYLHLRE